IYALASPPGQCLEETTKGAEASEKNPRASDPFSVRPIQDSNLWPLTVLRLVSRADCLLEVGLGVEDTEEGLAVLIAGRGQAGLRRQEIFQQGRLLRVVVLDEGELRPRRRLVELRDAEVAAGVLERAKCRIDVEEYLGLGVSLRNLGLFDTLL